MRWRALLVGTALVGCTSFRSTTEPSDAGVPSGDAGLDAADGGAPCVDVCASGDPNCRFDAFADGGCGDWKLGGNFPMVTGDCTGDALHIAASGTLDVIASLTLQTPQRAYGVHVAARTTLAAWDGYDVVSIQIGSSMTNEVSVVAEETLSKQLALRLCTVGSNGDPLCGDPIFVVTPGETHEIAFDLTAGGTALSIDCAARATTIALSLLPAAALDIKLGHVNGQPLDGTFDDVVVAWK